MVSVRTALGLKLSARKDLFQHLREVAFLNFTEGILAVGNREFLL